MLISDELIVGGGHREGAEQSAFLWAVGISDGEDAWEVPLPSLPVKGGSALGPDGEIYVTLENGQLLGLAPPTSD